MGTEELGSKLASMDELMGKTAEQVAFEGIAMEQGRGELQRSEVISCCSQGNVVGDERRTKGEDFDWNLECERETGGG